jgi:hypothetical protein
MCNICVSKEKLLEDTSLESKSVILAVEKQY